MAELIEQELAHIKLTEEYRHNVRKELDDRDKSFLKDKFVAPALIVLLTALVSGLVVPYILAKDEDKRRAVELKSRLIADVVGESAAAQMAIVRYNEQICDYWNAKVRAELRRANARLSTDETAKAGEYESIAADLRREYDYRIEVDRLYGDARVRLNVMIDRLESTMDLYYPACPQLQQFVSTVDREVTTAEDLINITHQSAVVKEGRTTIVKLATCKTRSECEEIADDAEKAIDKYGDQRPRFTTWNNAAKELAKYISKTTPKLTS